MTSTGAIKLTRQTPERCTPALNPRPRHHTRSKTRALAEPCSVSGCDELDYCREMCALHYYRWLRTGTTSLIQHKRKTPSVRFWARVDQSGECWLWTGITVKGYGRFDGRAAHRYAYRDRVGPIPAGLTLDHLCRVRACVRPEHLEPVTHAENCRRAKYRRDSCDRGHDLPLVSAGRRVCRECANERNRAYKQRQRDLKPVKTKEPLPHGRSKYVQERCRCDVCSDADRAYHRARPPRPPRPRRRS